MAEKNVRKKKTFDILASPLHLIYSHNTLLAFFILKLEGEGMSSSS